MFFHFLAEYYEQQPSCFSVLVRSDSFFILSVISHGDGFRERRALEWLIPIGIIIFFILSLSDTRILKSRVLRAFSFVGHSQT